MKIWPQSVIRELIAQAKASGEARAELESRALAERFRYSIYSFRKTHNIGYDVSITIDNNTVVVTKKPDTSVKILTPNNHNPSEAPETLDV